GGPGLRRPAGRPLSFTVNGRDPMSDEDLPIERRLFSDGLLFEELQILETKLTPTVGNEDWHVRIELQLDAELVPCAVFGFIYTIGLFSFHDGRPRGVSGKW